MSAKLKFGVLSYLNCLPATLALEQGVVGEEILRVERGTPAELNAMMRSRALDVSVVSVAEYFDNSDLYSPLEGYALWCDGPVQSVCLYSPHCREKLQARPGLLGVTPESATSVALAELLVPGSTTEPFRNLEEAREGLARGSYQAVLLIGDNALEPPPWTAEYRTLDMGSWWKDVTSHPMTYAIWVARRDLPEEKRVLAREQLRLSLEWGETNLEEVLGEGHRRSGLNKERLRAYLKNIIYRTTSRSEAGFEEFRRRLRGRCAV